MMESKNENERLAELYEYQILNANSEKELDELSEIASLVCDTPISLVTLIDKDKQWYKAVNGIEKGSTARKDSFCQHALHNPGEVLVVNDTLKDNRFIDAPAVREQPNVRFYAGAPLVTPKNNVLGTLCVVDTEPKHITNQQKRALKLLAKKAMDYLNSRRLLLKQQDRIEFNAKKLKKLTDQVPGLICQLRMIHERKIRFTFISKGIEQINKKLNPDEVKLNPKNLIDLVHPRDKFALIKSLKKSYSELSEWTSEFRIFNEEGTFNYYAASAIPEKIDEKTVVYYGFITNVTDRVEYERAMEQISFDISHVLRRPVTSLLGLINLIENEEPDIERLKAYNIHIKTVSKELDLFTRKLTKTYSLKRNMNFDFKWDRTKLNNLYT